MTTVKPWAQVVIPEHHPETWPDLEGFAEAEARGFSAPRQEARDTPSVPRQKRSLASLTEERDQLAAKRDRLGWAEMPLDHGAHSGIRRKRDRRDVKAAARTDRELEQFTKLTRRIDYLNSRIAGKA